MKISRSKKNQFQYLYIIVFGISPMIAYLLKENYLMKYATKKCYDVSISTQFTLCDFYINFK